jgi:hypothetical protein
MIEKANKTTLQIKKRRRENYESCPEERTRQSRVK